MPHTSSSLLRTAFDQYLGLFPTNEFEPVEDYLSYDLESYDAVRWDTLGHALVTDDLRELINVINHWHSYLIRWSAWNHVVARHNDNDAWELRREFLEAAVHFCLLQPSALRDSFVFFTTNAVHQVRLASEVNYPDRMDGDPTPSVPNPKPLSRRRKEKRLQSLLSHWVEAAPLMPSLHCLDDDAYRRSTSDYRNRTSHSIGPRLGIGITRTVTRSLVPAEKLVAKSDGLYYPQRIPGVLWVSYGYGGTDPLDYEESRLANLDQYRKARTYYSNLRAVLASRMKLMPASK